MLGVDLGVFQKKNHVLSFREAFTWTLVWVATAIAFYFLIRFHGNWIHGIDTLAEIQQRIDLYKHPIDLTGLATGQAIELYNKNLSLEYITGYLIEYSLSIDNIFVMILIFFSFNIPPRFYKRILFWGILGAIVMRFIFIFAASALIQRFAWFLYLFGGMLLIIGFKMAYEFLVTKKEERIDAEKHPVVKLASRFFNVSHDHHAETFFIRNEGKLFITPLLIVLMIIEFTDVMFAVDSVPAVFSVTEDPYIVFFSNIFAILGLRSLFFLVMDVMTRFYYLKLGLAALLTFVGVKMLVHDIYKIDTQASLFTIAGIILLSIIASTLRTFILKKQAKAQPVEKDMIDINHEKEPE